MKLFQKIASFYRVLLWENRRWLYIILLVFILGTVLGIAVSQTDPKITQTVIAKYKGSIDLNLAPGFSQSLFIFERNLQITLIAMFASVVFGLSSLFVAFSNGAILGLFLGFGEIYTKINPWQLFLLLFPHGIFEYAAVFIGLSFGLRLGLNWTLKNARGNRFKTFIKNLKELLAISLLVVIILALAAYVEGFWTAKIACILSGICR